MIAKDTEIGTRVKHPFGGEGIIVQRVHPFYLHLEWCTVLFDKAIDKKPCLVNSIQLTLI